MRYRLLAVLILTYNYKIKFIYIERFFLLAIILDLIEIYQISIHKKQFSVRDFCFRILILAVSVHKGSVFAWYVIILFKD